MHLDVVYRLRSAIKEARVLYFRLIILVGPIGSGKTRALQQLAKEIDAPLINVNLELSRRLLEVPEKQRPFQVLEILRELIREDAAEVIILDNLELLFSNMLKQDPLALLKKVSPNQLLIAAWTGRINRGNLIYAEPAHHEYRRYPVKDFLVVNMEPPT